MNYIRRVALWNHNYISDICGLWLLAFMLWLVALFNPVSAAPTIYHAPLPEWVVPLAAPYASETNTIAPPSGVHYLLLDTQVSAITERAYFYHFALQLTNEEAIEDNSVFSVEFDPTYQELTIHSVVIWRDGKQIDKLKMDEIELLRREKQMERLIYDGHWTASLILSDIRKGDVLDYSYTIKGMNPALSNHFSYQFRMDWSSPILKQFYRLLWPNDSQIYITPVNTGQVIKHEKRDTYSVYTLDVEERASLRVDKGSPSWYQPWGRVTFSDVANWSEVVAWAFPKYEYETPLGDEITSLVAAIRKDYSTQKQQAAAALRFVQNEVRYQGIEIGVGGFQPHPPAATLSRLYGDCKDKTTLLISILRSLGIKANPALVDTSSGRSLDVDGPRATAFNHVIAQVEISGTSYWLDPTMNNQYGSLDTIYQPNYGKALVLSKNSNNLLPMLKKQAGHSRIIKEIIDLRDETDGEPTYIIRSVYSGAEAQQFRGDINSTGQTQLEKNYLEFYSDYYSGIEAIEPIDIQDDKQSGKIYVEERYKVLDFWRKGGDKEKLFADFYSNALYPFVRVPEVRRRTSPKSIVYPIEIEQEIVVLLSGEWDLDNEDKHIESPYFDYQRSVSYLASENKLVLSYKYKSLADHVPTNDVVAYIASIEEVKDDLDYGLYTDIPKKYATDAADVSAGGENQTKLVENEGLTENQVLMIVFGAMLLLAVYVYIEYRLNQRHAPDNEKLSYYPVSSVKFFILSFLSLGLYYIYWFYKNWVYVKRREQSTVIPWGRALFCYLWYYPLYKSIERDACYSETKLKANDGGFVLLAILFFIASLLANTESMYTYIAILVSIAVALPLVERINSFTLHDNECFRFNSLWRPRHFVVGLFFFSFGSLIVAIEVNLIPGNGVVDGSKIWQHDIDYMRRIGVIEPDERIELFYAGGFISNRTDGNGFTQSHVFSYWKDDSSQKLAVETARFADISDISYTYGKVDEDMVVKVVRKDKSDFLLFVSPEGGKNKLFEKRLDELWKRYSFTLDALVQ